VLKNGIEEEVEQDALEQERRGSLEPPCEALQVGNLERGPNTEPRSEKRFRVALANASGGSPKVREDRRGFRRASENYTGEPRWGLKRTARMSLT